MKYLIPNSVPVSSARRKNRHSQRKKKSNSWYSLEILTDGLVRDQRLVAEAEGLGDVAEVGVLGDDRPLGVVHPVAEVGDGDLHSPVLFLVVELDVPVHWDGAGPHRTQEL